MQRKEGFEYDLGRVAEMWNNGVFRAIVDDPSSPQSKGREGWKIVSTFVQQITEKSKRDEPDAIVWAVYEWTGAKR
jgi:hypothetical protein